MSMLEGLGVHVAACQEWTPATTQSDRSNATSYVARVSQLVVAQGTAICTSCLRSGLQLHARVAWEVSSLGLSVATYAEEKG